MADSFRYHHPDMQDDSGIDPESDVDLNLSELDPISDQDDYSRPGKAYNERTQNYPIPLRNLSYGGRVRRKLYGQYGGGLGADGEDDDNDDARRLLDEEGRGLRRQFDSHETSPRAHHGRRWPRREDSTFGRFGSRLRLGSHASNTSRLSVPDEEEEPEPEPEEEHDPSANRTVLVGRAQPTRFPTNAVSNTKYSPWSFLPRTLYNEFSFFFNMYFLLVALSQVIPLLRIGYLSTYIAPLAFVLLITLGKEALDDIARRRRDAEANSEPYTILKFAAAQGRPPRSRFHQKLRFRSPRIDHVAEEEATLQSNGPLQGEDKVWEATKSSRNLRVGDVLKLSKDERVPADVVILKSLTNDRETAADMEEMAHSRIATSLVDTAGDRGSSEADSNAASPLSQPTKIAADHSGGEAFIRTDQLDGETDWKPRLATPLTAELKLHEFVRLQVQAGKPEKKVNDFVGTVELTQPCDDSNSDGNHTAKTRSASLTIDNTAWANTVIATNSTVYAVVVYTGSQTRQALSSTPSRSKTGLLEYEINSLTKILCFLTLALSLVLVGLEALSGHQDRKWYIDVMRYLILFSTIVPISLRVNLDMGKTAYAYFIEKDQGIPGTVVRTSTIPEDLGRIEYLLTDKTGTLTQNEMRLRKIHVGTVSYANESMEEISTYVKQGFKLEEGERLVAPSSATAVPTSSSSRGRRDVAARVQDVVLALAICHNVTPTIEEVEGQRFIDYQASSPDEIAIIKWTEQVGLRLLHRDRRSITLESVDASKAVVKSQILEVFPFTSDSKRMGIVVQFMTGSVSDPEPSESDIWFYEKGADTVMSSIVAPNDWLEEETANMAREGLRTLVVGRKRLSIEQYRDFRVEYSEASLALQKRDVSMAKVVRNHLERNLELLGVTGVEDKLQHDVKPSLELLRNAGIKIWMLTGDKVETARCVAVSARLVARGQHIHTMAKCTLSCRAKLVLANRSPVRRKDTAQDSLNSLRSNTSAALLIDGETLALMLSQFREEFISLAINLPAVIACRCSPIQKADIAQLIRLHTKKRICCIGDGGNDVPMINAADVGVGIVGKEGRQASLAADFSITQFCHLTKLLLWHGRNSYQRSAKLAQFVIHRGLLISVCQTVYSVASAFEPIALYKDWLLVGYATVYTMAPVFSLVLDRDVDPHLAHLYPELYKELKTGRSLSYRTFFIWVAVSIYQGCIIQGLSQILNGLEPFNRMVAVSFTVLVLNELFMVAFEVTTWHWIMAVSILGTAAVYAASVPFLGRYFDLDFVKTIGFWWRVLAIAALSLVPPYAIKVVGRTVRPPSYRKVQGF